MPDTAALPPRANSVHLAAHLALLAEVEQALSSASGPSRSHIFQRTAKLFLAHAGSLGGEAVDLFGEVFLRQIEGVDADALAALSAPLASIPQAPPKLMQRLAQHASAAVAAPVLMQTTSLALTDLMAIAGRCSEQHLMAIAQRKRVDAELAAVLIARGGQNTIDTLAKNPGAKYRVSDFGDLLGRATCDDRARVVTKMPVAVRNAETGPAIFNCMMADISPGGAKLQLPAALPLPETFILELTSVEHQQVQCRKIWARDTIAGLLFTSSLLALWGATSVPVAAPRTPASR